ncbi:MAG: energy-coupling factor transporter ATPase [Tissierellia bacterium]|nr:energy-coupling factor transporter ATPase [Tissierellia bacterium]
MIEIEDLVYSYWRGEENQDQPPAIDHLSLRVEKGEFLAVLGHNGSGKSTLAKCINGLFQPTSGRILVDGMDTREEETIWDIRSRAGLVFQNPDNQIVATTVEEDVAFGPENLGLAREVLRKRVDWALDVVKMGEFKRRAPYLLSGGQKQRVAIAGVLAMEPDYIILDEPTAMLDPNGRRDVMEAILKMNREENKTIILITHFMSEAIQADRVAVMDRGRLLLEGPPREVFLHVDTMKEIGLDVPAVTELTRDLIQAGLPLDPSILTREEFVDQLCHYLASDK